MISQAELKRILSYDKKTGRFTWRCESSTSRGRTGRRAGWLDSDTGYWKISIYEKNYLAHRLAWLYVRGSWPSFQIDHHNLNRADNVWTNIRRANQTLQNGNIKKRVNNTSGYKGVWWARNIRRWCAQIVFNKKHEFLGSFEDPIEAAYAYDRAARRLYGAFARINFPEANEMRA